jgi:hypothetical protein
MNFKKTLQRDFVNLRDIQEVSLKNSTKFINGLNLKPITQERLIPWNILILKTAEPN